jgi:hypothetical protein
MKRDIWALRNAVARGAPLGRVLERSEAWGQGWGTNVPLLAAALATADPGPVLELGTGHFSTPLLIEMCSALGREYWALETNTAWADKHSDLLRPTARILMVEENWVKWPVPNLPTRFALAFIDNQPDSTRLMNLRRMRGLASRIVVHDTCNPYFQGVDEELDTFKFRFNYTHMASVTSVVSDERPYP